MSISVLTKIEVQASGFILAMTVLLFSLHRGAFEKCP